MSRFPDAASRLAIGWLWLGALACASGSGGGNTVAGGNFPSREEVERIENAPAPATVFDEELRNAADWRVASPVPERIEARRWVPSGDWGEILADATDPTDGVVVPTAAMHCVANELARVALELEGTPDFSLRRFIVAACNAPVSGVSFRSLRGELGSTEDDGEVFERWRERASSMIRAALEDGGRTHVGIGFVRRGDRGALFVASGRPKVDLDPVRTTLAPGESFELRGRILEPAESIHAAVNRGRYGVALCDPVGDVRPPAFHFSCWPDPSDESAWVSLSFTSPNRVLGTRVLDTLVWPRGGERRRHRREPYTSPRPLADPAEFTQAFLEELNAVRTRAGLSTVVLDASQSATTTRVAPHFFAALRDSGSDELVDQLTLGLLAGWDVDGTIRMGSIAFGAVPETDDLAVLLGVILDQPMARLTLLDPEIERLAIGPIVGEVAGAPVLATVVTGYSMFHAETRDDDAEGLFLRLAAQREQRELPSPYRLIEVWLNAMQYADQVARGGTPEYALDDLLEASATSLSRDVRGWYAETSRLDEFEFPDEVVSAARLGAAIGVSHRKDPDDAWGRYVVLMVSVAH